MYSTYIHVRMYLSVVVTDMYVQVHMYRYVRNIQICIYRYIRMYTQIRICRWVGMNFVFLHPS